MRLLLPHEAQNPSVTISQSPFPSLVYSNTYCFSDQLNLNASLSNKSLYGICWQQLERTCTNRTVQILLDCFVVEGLHRCVASKSDPGIYEIIHLRSGSRGKGKGSECGSNPRPRGQKRGAGDRPAAHRHAGKRSQNPRSPLNTIRVSRNLKKMSTPSTFVGLLPSWRKDK